MYLVLQALIIAQTIIPGISIWQKVASIAVAILTGTNIRSDAYYNYACFQALVNNNFIIMSTQRSSCISRLQVLSLFIQA